MPTEVNDIDELESLLSGLSPDELGQLDELDGLDDLSGLEELDAPPAEPVAAKPTRKRRLKPLKEEPEEPELSALNVDTATGKVTSDDPEVNGDDDLAALADLDEKPESKPVSDPNLLAEQVIELMVKIPEEFGCSTEEDYMEVFGSVLSDIDASSTIEGIEKNMRAAFEAKFGKAVDPAEVEVEKVAESTEEVESKALGDQEQELDELLAGVEAAPTPKPVVTAPVKPVAVTPTKKVGQLNTFIDADQLQRDLHFTEATINDGMTRQAALFAHYARLSADATFQADRAKQQVELLEATLNQRFRDSLVASGTKFTEKSIDAMVIQDSSYQAAQERAHEAKAIASMVASAADSFRHRKDMLIQVGADLRLEKQGELRMKEHPGQRAVENM